MTKVNLTFIYKRLTKQWHFDLCWSSSTAQPASGGAGTSVVGKNYSLWRKRTCHSTDWAIIHSSPHRSLGTWLCEESCYPISSVVVIVMYWGGCAIIACRPIGRRTVWIFFSSEGWNLYTAHNFGGRNVPNAMDSQADSELKKYKSVSDWQSRTRIRPIKSMFFVRINSSLQLSQTIGVPNLVIVSWNLL